MASKLKGIVIEIGADTKPLEKALEGVKKHSNDIQSELKQVDRLLKLDPKNTDLLEQKQKLLAEAVSNTKSKLDTLKEAEKQVQQQFEQGKVGEDQYRALQREIIATEQNLDSLEQRLKETNSNWKNVADNLDNFGKKTTDIGKKLSLAVTTPIVGAGAAAFKMAADMEDALGAADQVFKGSSSEIKKWADELQTYYGISESEALTYANTMGAMLQNIGGLTEDEAAKQSEILVELAGDLTAMFGGTTESAVQALTGALKGNTSMLDNYGMGVNEATIKSKALEMGLIKEGEQLDLAGKQAATLQLIMEQTADAQGQAARESEGASGSMRGLTTELKNVAGELGQVLIPIITPFIAKLKEIIEKFGSMDPEMQKTIVTIAALAAAIGPLLMVVGSISSGIGALITLFSAGGAAAGVLGGAFTFLTGPIGIVIGVIGAVIAIGVLLYKNWDEIKVKAGELWSNITGIFEKIKNSISDKINGAKEAVWNAIEKIKGFFKFEWSLPKIKLPHFSIQGEFSLNPPSIPKLGVEWYKTGGIFTRPSVIGVGEGGEPEGVFPLSYLKELIGSGGKSTVNHTGTITVRGVNNRNELMDIVDVVIDDLRRGVRL